MKTTTFAALICTAPALCIPLTARAETCQPAYSYSIPGTASGTLAFSMTACTSDDYTRTTITGTQSFSNYADTAGETIDGSYNFSIATTNNGSTYEYTYGMNGGPITYAKTQTVIYYDQFSYGARFDINTFQYSYLNFSGGWRINGVYYPASQVYNYADFSGSTPNIDLDALNQVTNPPPDTTPDSFSLGSQSNVAPGAVVESDSFTVSGIAADAAISISGGEYSINGGSWTSAAGTVALGNQVKVRLTAPSSYGQGGSATLSIGGVSSSFAVTTRSSTTVAAVTDIFSNAGTAATVVNGVVHVTATPTTPLQFTSGATLDAVVTFDTTAPVPVLSGTATLNYTRGGSDTRFQIRTINGSPALAPISGSVTIDAPASGSTIPLTGNSTGSASLTTSATNTAVVTGPDASRNLIVAVGSGGRVTYQASGRGRSVPSSFDVYPGEAVVADEAGTAGQVRLGSFGQDGLQAGDYLANLPHAASTLNVPIVTGTSSRFSSDWATLVGRAIAAKFSLGTFESLSQNSASGMLTLVTDTGTYRFLPVGTLALADAALTGAGGGSRTVSVGSVAANLTNILDSNLAFAVAPATSYADLATALKHIDSSASLEILGDGVLKASLGGTDYIAQPASATVAGNVTANICPGFDTVANQLALCDSNGTRQVLYAAFADTDTLRSTFRTDLGLPQLSVTNTGSAGAYTAVVGSATYTLNPDITLSTPPAAQAGKLWWSEGGKIYIRYPNGAAQGFSLQ
jgi:hypothetical protein